MANRFGLDIDSNIKTRVDKLREIYRGVNTGKSLNKALSRTRPISTQGQIDSNIKWNPEISKSLKSPVNAEDLTREPLRGERFAADHPIFSTIFKVLNFVPEMQARAAYAITGVEKKAVNPTWVDFLKDSGMNEAGALTLGIGLDIFADPITYLSAGTMSSIRGVKAISLLDDATEYTAKVATKLDDLVPMVKEAKEVGELTDDIIMSQLDDVAEGELKHWRELIQSRNLMEYDVKALETTRKNLQVMGETGSVGVDDFKDVVNAIDRSGIADLDEMQNVYKHMMLAKEKIAQTHRGFKLKVPFSQSGIFQKSKGIDLVKYSRLKDLYQKTGLETGLKKFASISDSLTNFPVMKGVKTSIKSLTKKALAKGFLGSDKEMMEMYNVIGKGTRDIGIEADLEVVAAMEKALKDMSTEKRWALKWAAADYTKGSGEATKYANQMKKAFDDSDDIVDVWEDVVTYFEQYGQKGQEAGLFRKIEGGMFPIESRHKPWEVISSADPASQMKKARHYDSMMDYLESTYHMAKNYGGESPEGLQKQAKLFLSMKEEVSKKGVEAFKNTEFVSKFQRAMASNDWIDPIIDLPEMMTRQAWKYNSVHAAREFETAAFKNYQLAKGDLPAKLKAFFTDHGIEIKDGALRIEDLMMATRKSNLSKGEMADSIARLLKSHDVTIDAPDFIKELVPKGSKMGKMFKKWDKAGYGTAEIKNFISDIIGMADEVSKRGVSKVHWETNMIGDIISKEATFLKGTTGTKKQIDFLDAIHWKDAVKAMESSQASDYPSIMAKLGDDEVAVHIKDFAKEIGLEEGKIMKVLKDQTKLTDIAQDKIDDIVRRAEGIAQKMKGLEKGSEEYRVARKALDGLNEELDELKNIAVLDNKQAAKMARKANTFDAFLLKRDKARNIRKMAKIIKNPARRVGSQSDILKNISYATSKWKYMATMLRTLDGFTARNAITGYMLATLGGARRPSSLIQSFKMAVGKGMDDAIETASGKTYTLNEVKDLFMRHQVHGGWASVELGISKYIRDPVEGAQDLVTEISPKFRNIKTDKITREIKDVLWKLHDDFEKGKIATTEATKKIANLLGKIGKREGLKADRVIRGLNEGVELQTRFWLFLDKLKDGMRPGKAARITRNTMVDYMNFSESEEFIRNTVMPFYSWFARSIPVALKSMFQKPAFMKGLGVLKHDVEALSENTEEMHAIMPEYMNDYYSVITPLEVKDKQGNTGNIVFMPEVPTFELTKFDVNPSKPSWGKNTMRRFMAQLTPLKIVMEMSSNFSHFMGAPIENFKGAMKPANPGMLLLPDATKEYIGMEKIRYNGEEVWGVPAKQKYFMNSLIPFLRTSEYMVPGTQKSKGLNDAEQIYKMTSKVMGFKAIPFYENKAKKRLMSRYKMELRDARKLAKQTQDPSKATPEGNDALRYYHELFKSLE